MPAEPSILKSIRQRIGPSAGYDVFDNDLIVLINSAFSRLRQLGVGPDYPFYIEDEDAEWSDFMEDGEMEEIKDYVYLSVKIIFDPPANSGVLNAYKEQIAKYESLLKDVAYHGY